MVTSAHRTIKEEIIMAKVDMKEIMKNTDNSAEINELKANEQAEANGEPAELIDNALKATEDTNEIDKEAEDGKGEEPKPSGKIVVRYIGGGIWKDSKGDLWASENKSVNILSERQYDADEFENREDIKFMLKYGAMKETHVK